MAYLILEIETGCFFSHYVPQIRLSPSGMIEVFRPVYQKIIYPDRKSAEDVISNKEFSELYEIIEYDG